MKPLALTTFLVFSALYSTGQISVTWVNPGSVWGDPMQVAVKISSTYQVDSAKATVSNRTTYLTYKATTTNFKGTISMRSG